MELQVKILTLTLDGTTFVQYVDANEVDDLLQAVKRVEPGLAHFVNNKCIYNGAISGAVCNKWEQTLQQEIN